MWFQRSSEKGIIYDSKVYGVYRIDLKQSYSFLFFPSLVLHRENQPEKSHVSSPLANGAEEAEEFFLLYSFSEKGAPGK